MKRNDWKILVGPFDDLKEEIVKIFKERAGLSEDMGWLPRIDKAGPVFHNGQEFFSSNIDRMHEIRGEVMGEWFRISLSETSFSQDPGPSPHFHHHAITRIEIPGKIIDLFRGYPEYYVYCGQEEIRPHEFLNEMIFKKDSHRVVRYKPNDRVINFWGTRKKIKTDSILKRINNPVICSDLYPDELEFEKVYQVFEKFFNKLIALLQIAPVTTHNFNLKAR